MGSKSKICHAVPVLAEMQKCAYGEFPTKADTHCNIMTKFRHSTQAVNDTLDISYFLRKRVLQQFSTREIVLR